MTAWRHCKNKEKVRLPVIPDYATNNAHMYYMVCGSLEQRTALINFMKAAGVQCVFHYQSLHNSGYFAGHHDGRSLPNAERFSDTLVRLPFYYELEGDSIDYICNKIHEFFG